MNPVPPHFIIEEGPEVGREITVPESGARVGRANENDIVIADPSMSRFQCRLYFKDGFLHLMDLGSTNASLVNDLEVNDAPLRHGDQVLIGASVLRVVNDGLSADPETAVPFDMRETISDGTAPSVTVKAPTPASEEPKPAPAPAAESSPPAADGPGPGEASVDLGFGKRPEEEAKAEQAEKEKRSSLSLIMITLLTILIVFGGGVVFLMSTTNANGPKKSGSVAKGVEVHYEKVIATTDNIFRYALTVKDDEISAEIHDIHNQRNVTRSEKLTDREFSSLKADLKDQYLNYEKLSPSYESDSERAFDFYDLTVVLGPLAHTVRVRNQPEPTTFRQLRETLEGLADAKLGLSTLDMPPEMLKAQAQESWEVGMDLYEARLVKDDNLWQALKKMQEISWLLDTIEPKPDYYRQAVEQEQQWSEELDKKCNELMFAAQREAHVGQYPAAVNYLSRLIAARPDPNDELYRRAQKSKSQLELMDK